MRKGPPGKALITVFLKKQKTGVCVCIYIYIYIWHIPLFLWGQCDEVCVFYHFRLQPYTYIKMHVAVLLLVIGHITHLRQQCHITTVSQHNCHITTMSQQSSVTTQHCDFSGEALKVLKCYNFLWVQRRHNCSPAASFTNCVMTLYLLKVHLKPFLSIPITEKCQILSCDTLFANERYVDVEFFTQRDT
jgi:hypothetical protein